VGDYTAVFAAVKTIESIDCTDCMENRVIGAVDGGAEVGVAEKQFCRLQLFLCAIESMRGQCR